jgi:hypothetical protein
VHTVALIFDFVQPLVASQRGVDQLRELRRDPFRQRRRVGAPARYAGRHESRIRLSGRRMLFLEMVDLADMLRRMGELEGYSLAMPAGRKAATSDNRDLMQYVGVHRDEILRETLELLAEIPESWPRASILVDVAPHLPKSLFEKAFAAARAIPDETYRAKSLCLLLAHRVPASRRDNIYDEAISVVRQIDNDLERARGFNELAESLPPRRRDQSAREAWEILRHHPNDGRDGNAARERVVALTRTVACLPDDLVPRAVQEALNISKKISEEDRSYLAQQLERTLDARARRESVSEPKAPSKTKGSVQPQHRIQRELLARLHIEQVRGRSEPLELGELRSLLEMMDSAGDLDDGYSLRHLTRLLPGEVHGDTLKELFGAAKSVRWSRKGLPVYLDIAARLSGKEQGRVLCQALLSDADNPAKAEFEPFVEKWRQDDYGLKAGLGHLDKLLSGLAKWTRPRLMREVAVLAPVLSHLCDRKINSDLFLALRDVTRWWP